MKPEITLEQFSGPFELLLTLLEEEKLDITTIALSRVTEQYFTALHAAPTLPAGELADFLFVASRLLHLKSTLILEGALREEEGAALTSQLKLYKAYFNASKNVAALIEEKRFSFFRDVRVAPQALKGFHPPRGVDVHRLQATIEALVQYIQPLLALPTVALARAISIKERIRAIEERIARVTNIHFHEFTKNTKDKIGIIVNFLALLELVKQRSVAADQEAIFGDIVITRNGAVRRK